MAGGAASAAGSTANPRPFRLPRASSSDVTGQGQADEGDEPEGNGDHQIPVRPNT
jgi:hypothetical protein